MGDVGVTARGAVVEGHDPFGEQIREVLRILLRDRWGGFHCRCPRVQDTAELWFRKGLGGIFPSSGGVFRPQSTDRGQPYLVASPADDNEPVFVVSGGGQISKILKIRQDSVETLKKGEITTLQTLSLIEKHPRVNGHNSLIWELSSEYN